MSVSMGLQHKVTGEYRDIPLGPLSGFREGWLPACNRLGLQLVPLFSDGALTWVPDELVPEIIRELQLLLPEVEANSETAWVAERIRNALAAFAETTPAEWKYDFG